MPPLSLSDTVERSKGSMVRDPGCALVRQAAEKSIQEIKSWENYKSPFPRTWDNKVIAGHGQDALCWQSCTGKLGEHICATCLSLS